MIDEWESLAPAGLHDPLIGRENGSGGANSARKRSGIFAGDNLAAGPPRRDARTFVRAETPLTGLMLAVEDAEDAEPGCEHAQRGDHHDDDDQQHIARHVERTCSDEAVQLGERDGASTQNLHQERHGHEHGESGARADETRANAETQKMLLELACDEADRSRRRNAEPRQSRGSMPSSFSLPIR